MILFFFLPFYALEALIYNNLLHYLVHLLQNSNNYLFVANSSPYVAEITVLNGYSLSAIITRTEQVFFVLYKWNRNDKDFHGKGIRSVDSAGMEMRRPYRVDCRAVRTFQLVPSGGRRISARPGGAMLRGGSAVYTYCLFCETASCIFLARIAEAILPCRAIQPKQVQHRLKKGRVDDVVRDFMPGYLFLYFEEDPFPGVMRLPTIPGVHRFLGDSNNKYVLTGPDEQFALMIREKSGLIGKMEVYEEGERLHLYKSDLDVYDIQIVKVDRRKGRMKIQFTFAENPVATWVEFVIRQ